MTTRYQIGDLRITGPTKEIDAFLDWLKNQNCYIYGYSDIQAISGFRSVEISIDIYSGKKEDSPGLKRGDGSWPPQDRAGGDE